jgi:hypothetical protein
VKFRPGNGVRNTFVRIGSPAQFSFASRIFSHAEARRARREENWIFSACSASPREPLPRVLVCLLRRRSVRRSAPRPGSAPRGYRRNHGPSATSLKHRIRIHQQGGDAATVAGGVDPGFHTWPPGHIPQDNGCETIQTASSDPVPCQKIVRRGVRCRDRGRRPTATGAALPTRWVCLDRVSGDRGRGVLSEEKLKAGIRRTDNSKPAIYAFSFPHFSFGLLR